MASRRTTSTLWTCDRCDDGLIVDDMGDGYPPGKEGWSRIVSGTIREELGNKSAIHLCGPCSTALGTFLGGDDG